MYLESLQDLLAPDKTNISIVEDAKSGEVSLPGAAVVELRDLNHFNELLQYGEANRYASNTKLNTESSRSHAILVVWTITNTTLIFSQIVIGNRLSLMKK